MWPGMAGKSFFGDASTKAPSITCLPREGKWRYSEERTANACMGRRPSIAPAMIARLRSEQHRPPASDAGTFERSTTRAQPSSIFR